MVSRMNSDRDVHAAIAEAITGIYRKDSRRVLATLIRLLGDFELAEEGLQDAFTAAVQQWAKEGIPENPFAWLVSAGRFKAIDNLRRRARFDARLDQIANELETVTSNAAEEDEETIEDDMLRLIFTCCHPALSADAQVALTLREVCGMTTEEIARAFLTPPPTLAQRIVRAKGKIREAGIPYEVPARAELAERMSSVLRVIYLVFNEGYFASAGDSLVRPALSDEAIRLGRLLLDITGEPEARGLLALMLLHDARRASRTTPDGEVVTLEKQDRSLWNHGQIAQAAAMIEASLVTRAFGPYTLQAAIAAVHAESPSAEVTDWNEIVGLYDALIGMQPSPVIELNRAVAVAMRDGLETGLALIDELIADGSLANYALAHASRADLCRRLGWTDQARAGFERALELSQQVPERQLLERRLAELRG